MLPNSICVHMVCLGGSKVNIYQGVRMMSSASMFINPPRKISMVLGACFCSDFVTVKKKTHTHSKKKNFLFNKLVVSAFYTKLLLLLLWMFL